jgi:hypothetical protein
MELIARSLMVSVRGGGSLSVVTLDTAAMIWLMHLMVAVLVICTVLHLELYTC